MKLEVGQFVRTINGKIWIIKSQQAISGHKKDILKASHNIIDLIEVGDYVNGYRVTEIETLPTKQKLVVVGYGYDADEISENNIETIVTKEQFEAMQYKVVEEC